MMNNIEKKKNSRGILDFRYIFGNHWDSNQPSYLILSEILTIKKKRCQYCRSKSKL